MSSRCSADPLGGGEVGLGGDRDLGGAPDLGQLLDEEPVAGTDLLVRREADPDHVDLGPRRPHQVVEPLARAASAAGAARGCRPGSAGRRAGCTMPRTTVRVVCGLSEVIDDLRADQRVGQRRLAGVGPADEAGEPAPEPLVGHRRPLGRVVVGPDLLVGLAGGLAGPPDRSRVDGARLPLPDRRASSPSRRTPWTAAAARASGACGSPASARTPPPSRSSPRPRASPAPRRPRRAGSRRRRAGRAR